jgi:hypothetical protein
MCSVWISEQTAIISLYSINRLVFYNRHLTLCSPAVTIFTTSLTLKNFTFYPQCVYVFCVDLRANSDYFPIQHSLAGFYNRDFTFCSPVVTICTTSLTFNNSTFCPNSVFMCFVWIWEQTAIISLYSINWFFITEKESVYCAVRTGFLNAIQSNFRPFRMYG